MPMAIFTGETERAEIRFHNSLINVVIDRFGEDVLITSSDDNCFTVSIDVAASPAFIALLLQFGDKLKILSSDTLT